MNNQTVLLLAGVLILAYAVLTEKTRLVRFIFGVVIPLAAVIAMIWYAVQAVR